MRILHLNDRLSDRGGADIHLMGVIHAQRASHQVFLAVGRSDRTVAAPCPTTFVPGLDSRTPRACALQPLLDRIEPDLVHIHNVVNPVVLEQAEAWPAVMTVQDHRLFCPGRGKLTARGEVCRVPMSREACGDCFDDPEYFEQILALTSRRLQAASRLSLVVLSSYMRGELVEAGVPADRVFVVPPFVHGVGDDGTRFPACVLFCGRLVEAKGVWDAVEAWRIAGLELPLVLAGTGSLRQRLEGVLRAEPVHIPGWVPHGRVGALYRVAQALIMPSRWQEPFGIAGLEALSLGVPVVAWESGGIAEWYTGPPLTPWGDVEALAVALRDRVGTRGAMPGGFETSTLMGRLDAVYRDVVDRTRGEGGGARKRGGSR